MRRTRSIGTGVLMALIDVSQLAQEITPYVTAAVRAYGTAVFAQVEDSAADASVDFGRRVIQRMTGRRRAQDPPSAAEAALTATVAEMAANPADSDLVILLRGEIRRALSADSALTADLAAQTKPPLASPSVAITASGERSLAAHTVTGNVHTGDVINTYTRAIEREHSNFPLHVTAKQHSNHIMTMIVPIADQEPEIGPRPLGVSITVEAFTSQAVILHKIRPLVVSRSPARPCYLRYRMGIPMPPRAFTTDLDERAPSLKPKQGRQGPPPDFPFTVTDSGPELFLIFATSQNEIDWTLELDWSSAGRRGTEVIDDDGEPFHFHPGAPTLDRPQPDRPENWPIS